MKTFLLVFLFAAACTKPNPNRCCTDEADCMAQGLPANSTCDEGLLCRGGQCIAITCSNASDCDASAPYCVDASCTEMCVADTQCPGSGQNSSDIFCVSGSCAECRTGADCAAATPVCDSGTCRACRAHDECASGICGDDGQCVAESQIAYVDLTGSQVADCSKQTPCSTITRALQIDRPYTLINSGNYASGTVLTVNGQHSFIGHGPTQPQLSRSTPGSVIAISSGTLKLENLLVRGGTATTGDDFGAAVLCSAVGGAPSVRLRGVTLTNNVTGVHAQACSVQASSSSITSNTVAASMSDATGSFDRCFVAYNNGGLILDGGLYTLTNNFIVRNAVPSTSAALDLYTNQNGTKVEFNTIADNTGLGVNCNVQGPAGAFPSNIIARNTSQTVGPNCSFPSSIIAADVAGINFVSANAMPYDYHIQAGSIAIDTATVSTNDHDYDGDARPQGAGRDVGADEFKP
jgi:hypothetical protein